MVSSLFATNLCANDWEDELRWTNDMSSRAQYLYARIGHHRAGRLGLALSIETENTLIEKHGTG
jgi:hypothetical protein